MRKRASRANSICSITDSKKASRIPLISSKAEGAARKSAAINPRNRRSSTTASSNSSSSDEENSSESSKSKVSTSTVSRRKPRGARSKSKTVEPSSSSSSSSSESEEENVAEAPNLSKVPEEGYSSEDIVKPAPNEPSESSSSSSSSSDDDSEPPVVKVDCSIQCDMDLDSEAEPLKSSDIPEPPSTASKQPVYSEVKVTTEETFTVTTEVQPEPIPVSSSHPSSSNIPHIPSYPDPPNFGVDPPFSPFARPPDFYPSMNLGPPPSPYMNSIHVVNGTQQFSQIASHQSMMNPIAFNLPQTRGIFSVNPMGMPGTLATTFQQTHIRTLTASNVESSMISLTRAQFPPSVGFLPPRPPVWSPIDDTSRSNPYSAFRSPKDSAPMLPLSIIQPQVSNGMQGSQHIRIPYSTAAYSTGFRPVPGTSSSNFSNPAQGYVSIVPKYDRKSSKIVIPPSQTPPKNYDVKIPGVREVKELPREGKKEPGVKGRKRKNQLPKPMSPLTVRKDSVTPATYSSKK